MIPHTTATYLTKQILSTINKTKTPHMITTLHNTNITIIKNNKSYSKTTTFYINQSDNMTTISKNLHQQTLHKLTIHTKIHIIPNFLNYQYHQHLPKQKLTIQYQTNNTTTKLITHISNFHPIKQTTIIIKIFQLIHKHLRAQLLLINNNPNLTPIHQQTQNINLKTNIKTLNKQKLIVPLLSITNLFLLPSSQKNFKLTTLKTITYKTPIITSHINKLPKIINHKISNFLHPPNNIITITTNSITLLTNTTLHKQITATNFHTIHKRFCTNKIIPKYKTFYHKILKHKPKTLKTTSLHT